MTRMHALLVSALATSLGLAACDKKDDEKNAKGTPAAKGAAPEKGTTPDKGAVKLEASSLAPAGGKVGPWGADFDPAATTAKLQGAWVLRDVSALGRNEAWEIKGNKVTIFDGTKEETLDLSLSAPCELKVTKSENGGSSSTTSHFAFVGDELHLGLGDAGIKKGDTVVACISNGVYVSKGGSCQFYTEMFGDWSGKPATCTLEGDTFTAKSGSSSMEYKVKVSGDTLLSEQLLANKAEKASDFAAAKAKIKK